MKIGLLFPGQGVQSVGMGRALSEAYAEAREVFARADEAYGGCLSKTIFEGPEEALRRTDMQQPAIITASLAALAAARAAKIFAGQTIGAVAGLSVGEYAAAYAAGALTLEDTVRLTRRRGELMQAASEAEPSGMAAIIGLDEAACGAACAQAADLGVVRVANVNSPEQVVIAGAKAPLEKAQELCRAAGAKRVVPLKVAGAFHTPLMASAAEGLAQALAQVTVSPLQFPVVQNVCAQPVTDTADLRQNLVDQLTRPVRWLDCVKRMVADGVEAFFEIGPGRTLTGMVKRIARDVPCTPIGRPEDLEALRM